LRRGGCRVSGRWVSLISVLLSIVCMCLPENKSAYNQRCFRAAPKTNNQPQFILQLDELRPKRLTPSYLFPKGTCTECQFATFFSLKGDRLFADGELVATNEGTTHQPLLETPSTAAIDNGFSLEEGILQWRHPSFTGGKASFCLSESNTVVAVFNETSIPTDCAPANLVNVPCKFVAPKQISPTLAHACYRCQMFPVD
jgi:syndecan 1